MRIQKFCAIFFLLSSTLITANAHEKEKYSRYDDIGVFVGGAFYSGDLNPYKFMDFQQAGLALGALYRINYDRRNTWRFGFNYGKIRADDFANTTDLYSLKRGLSFQSNIFEVNSIYEFNFFPYEMGYPTYPASPYIFAGLGGFFFNPTVNYDGAKYKLKDYKTEAQGVKTDATSSYKRVQICIPMGVGCKLSLGKKVGVQLEWGVRKLFTDYIDDVSGSYPSYKFLKEEMGVEAANLSGAVDYNKPKKILGNVGRMRGNANNKDWYSYLGLSITFKISYGSKCPSFNG